MATTSAAKKKQTTAPPAVLKKLSPVFMPAPGKVDTLRQQIEAAPKWLDELPSDEYLPMVRNHAIDFANALGDGHAFLWELSDAFADQHAAAMQMQASALQYMKENDKPTFTAKLARDVRDAVVAKNGSRASTLARSAVVRGEAFKSFLEASVDDYTGPLAMSMRARKLTLEDHFKIERLACELRAHLPTDLLGMFDRMSARGEDEKLAMFCDAVVPFMIECRDMPAPKLLGRFEIEGSRINASNEKDAAWRLLEQIKKRRIDLMPQSLRTGNKVLGALRTAFAEVFGVNPRLMTPDRFSARFLSGHGDPNVTGDKIPFETDPSWTSRYITSPFKLPGYSAPQMRTANGLPVRT